MAECFREIAAAVTGTQYRCYAASDFKIIPLIFTKEIIYTQRNKYHSGIIPIAITDAETTHTHSAPNAILFGGKAGIEV